MLKYNTQVWTAPWARLSKTRGKWFGATAFWKSRLLQWQHGNSCTFCWLLRYLLHDRGNFWNKSDVKCAGRYPRLPRSVYVKRVYTVGQSGSWNGLCGWLSWLVCIFSRWGNLWRRRPALIDNSRPWGLVLAAILGTDRQHFVFEKLHLFHCENLNETKLRQLKMYETNTWIVNHNKDIYEIYLSIMKYIIKTINTNPIYVKWV